MENYEQKYKEALEQAKQELKDCGSLNCDAARQIFRLFPELKESEDERIRKELIDFFKSREYNCSKRFISWLEKQDKTGLGFFENGENEKREFVGYGFLKCKGDFLSFKEGETYWLEYVGRDNYNVRSDNLLGQTFHITPQQLYTVFRPTTWLEKQGEQKSFDHENANIQQKDFAPESAVEPKFKVGDWVIFKDGSVYQVEKIENYEYTLRHILGGSMPLPFGSQNLIRPWTIQDAKEGDVLVCEDKRPFIFKDLLDPNHPDCPVAYCGIDYENSFIISSGVNFWTDDNVEPATKEQRDLLFQKMHETGYIWDSNKKELIRYE